MASSTKQKKTCSRGHTFYKSSDCPVCPVCEAERETESGFLEAVGAPARRALEREGIATAQDLAERTERDILALHGVGPSAIPKLRKALAAQGLAFKEA